MYATCVQGGDRSRRLDAGSAGDRVHGESGRRIAAPHFTREEYDARLAALRQRMAAHGAELLLVSTPENIFYLTGLDHWGYFAPHVLLVPEAGEMVLVARAMERVTVANQVTNARFEGHADSETAADVVARLLGNGRQGAARIGIEAWSSGLSHGLAQALKAGLPAATWLDLSGLVGELRQVKSPAEQAYMRQAAAVSDTGAAAAIAAIQDGASERDVAAACQYAMTEAGGTFPGFGPFIRSTARLGEEHTSWTDQRLAAGDAVFLELSGCVARYHAPLGRLVHIGRAPESTSRIAGVCHEAFDEVVGGLRDGALFRDVYAAWQRVVDRAGLSHYRRHHCGYAVGISFPPTWTGGNGVIGLRHDSDAVVRSGMAFHVLSWLMGTGQGDFFLSNAVLVGDAGAEVLTRTSRGISIR
jgi:Xaa-Pro dipeptidase